MAETIRNVFISHIHRDDAGIEALRQLAKRHGYNYHSSSIDSSRPNAAHNEQYIKSAYLEPAIRWAGVVIVYMTPLTHASRWVNWEIEYAERTGKRIVGIWGPGAGLAEIPEALKKYADAVVDWNDQKIIDAVEGRINNWQNPDGTLREPQPLARYSCR